MLYLDYSRAAGEWLPNVFGGNENLGGDRLPARDEHRRLPEHPGAITAAEESTAWPGVSRPVHDGGLGFGFKWNMGFMHDTLAYIGRDPDLPAAITTTTSRGRCCGPSTRTTSCRSRTTRSCTARVRCTAACRATTGRGAPNVRALPRVAVDAARQEADLHGLRDRPAREWNHDTGAGLARRRRRQPARERPERAVPRLAGAVRHRRRRGRLRLERRAQRRRQRRGLRAHRRRRLGRGRGQLRAGGARGLLPAAPPRRALAARARHRRGRSTAAPACGPPTPSTPATAGRR